MTWFKLSILDRQRGGGFFVKEERIVTINDYISSNKQTEGFMAKYLVESIVSRMDPESRTFLNFVVYGIPEEEKQALIGGIRKLLSGNEEYGVIVVPKGWGDDVELLDFNYPAPRGVIFIDDIAAAKPPIFNHFRYLLKEPESAGIPAGWVMVSFWEDKALDLYDEGIASAVSTCKYKDLVEDGETFAEYFAKVELNKE